MTLGFVPVLLGLLGLLNVLGFVLVGSDKARSVSKEERFPEVYFFFLSIFFASVGVLLGMLVFRHKTSKLYFPLGIGFLLLEQLALIYLLLTVFGISNNY
jgi:uncharacterized membrane protein YsdA (DUF1294 family)